MEPMNWKKIGSTAVPSFDRRTYEQSRVDWLNSTPGNLTGMDCPKCRNRGYTARLREDLTLCIVPCDCQETRRSVQRMERSGLEKSIRDMTFDKFRAEEPWQRQLLEGAREYAREGSGWLLICGQSGSGKTHLCTAVCRERLLRGEAVRYMAWREEAARLKAFSQEPQAREAALQELKQSQVLYIDDLFKTGRGPDGAALPTAADINLAFEILNHRYVSGLPTILSTEKLVRELTAIDEATASRILERCGRHVYAIARNQRRNHRFRSRSTSRPV